MTTARTIALASALIATLAASTARAQEMPDFVEFTQPQGPRIRAVMSGADFDAAMEAVGFDEGQRTTAGSMFDDAQARMFEAKRAADAQARGVGLFDRSARAVEERSKAARELRTRMLATVDDLFAALGAVATAEQQPALARERAKARRSTIRATMPPAGLGVRVASTDVDASLSRAGIDPAVVTAASRAAAPLDERLESALVRAADARDASDRAAAQAREGKGDREAERKAMREAYAAVGQVHRDALAAVAAALPPADARAVCSTAARRIWPATSDARAPERAIGQLLGDDLPAERRAAIEAIAATWWAAWWPATLKMAEASEQGGPFTNKKALDEPRRAADRAAWQALAGADEANRDFHLANAEAKPDGKQTMLGGGRGGPSLPGREGSGVAGGEAIEAVGMMIASTVTVAATPSEPGEAVPAPPEAGENNVMTFTLDASDLQGGAIVLGDASIEMADGAFDATAIELDEAGMEFCGARLPAAIDEAEARSIATLLGVPGDGATLTSLLDDYRGRVRAIDEELGTGVREMLRGTSVRWMGNDDGEPEVPEANLRKSVPAIDQYVDRLAALDAELIASIASLGTPAGGAADAALARRARTRANAVRYPVEGAMVDGSTRFVEPWDAIPADAGDAARTAARAAIDAWSPQASAAVEAKRAALRTGGTDLLLIARADAARMREAMAGSKQGGGGPQQFAMQADPEAMKRRMDLYGQLDRARTALVASSVAGRDAVEAAIPAELRGAFRAAWNARAAPGSQRDPKDALPAIDRARGLDDLTDRQRTQLDALRTDHAALHAAACNSIAELQVAQTLRDAAAGEADGTFETLFDSSRLLEDARFERTELNARSLRRLRSMLTPEQVKRIPALGPRRRGRPAAIGGFSPATIQAAPAQTSP
ncbi:MAG: hypothetical protein ACKOJI_03125 [Phycisphaerales bacterium]